MQFRDLQRQYDYLKADIDTKMHEVLQETNFIQGRQVKELEEKLAEYVGVNHCITCGNGTDALQLALMAWEIGENDAVFVPDFTFFSSGEVVSCVGATPVFVDVDDESFNISACSLEKMIQKVIKEGKLTPKVIIAVDLFGQPADYPAIRQLADKYNLLILEDGAQGFGGKIGDKMACSFGDISTTSFFPAKPLGCYGDGGAVFTDNDKWADLISSYKVHGKGTSKYDNIRIGMNSRLDTLQAAVLLAKLPSFSTEEIEKEQEIASEYTKRLKGYVKTPKIASGFLSSYAQYTIQLNDKKTRDDLQMWLKENGIPSMVYYQKPMHRQEAFDSKLYRDEDFPVTNRLSETVLSLPFHPFLKKDEIETISDLIVKFFRK